MERFLPQRWRTGQQVFATTYVVATDSPVFERARRSSYSSPMEIDRAKLRAQVRKMGDDYVYYMFDRAIELLSSAQLAEIAGQYMDVNMISACGPPTADLLAMTTAFRDASLRGEFYAAFFVDSSNFMTVSTGTRGWVAECHRLIDRCIAEVADPGTTRQAFEMIFDLLRRIDACEEIIFFGDEHGSWQVQINWRKVFPAWFACLAATTTPNEFAKLVLDAIIELDGEYDSEAHFAAALTIGTEDQRTALVVARAARERRRRLLPVERKPQPTE
ncbi:MAG: hypothetical protein IT381_05965 [Deltaproteobacteria bacterium]|nr:hypothetical protein [Deltaproteobacteria bacterium]